MLYSPSVKRIVIGLAVLITMVISAGQVSAQYQSSNYKANEVFFGSGGDTGQSSTSYKAQASVGGIGSGQYSSANYQAFAGFLTPGDPFLEMQIDTAGPVNLGALQSTSTATGIAQFHVRAYLDGGYTVQTISGGLSSSGPNSHTITNMSTTAASVIGQEQFGINLVQNTSPAGFGSNPSPQPNSAFAFGQAASGYSTQNQYKYNPGDTIACSGTGGTCGNASGWGETIFTISYIANIGPITPAGYYSMVQDLVAVPTY